MFEYPLKKREIYNFLATKTSPETFEQALSALIAENIIYKIDHFYSLFNNHTLIERRRSGNKHAELLLKKASMAARVIASFPFVTGVAVSGSLSKRVADKDADIDFFIVTSANRLWIARSFLHLFKKMTFLFNMQDYYCMNYFIDEAELSIREKNIYTATEVSTLMPLYGNTLFDRFFKINAWAKVFFPNNYLHVSYSREIRKTWLRWLAEKIFDNKTGDRLDNFLMKLTVKSWANKTSKRKRNSKGHVLGMHSGKHFSKPDPSNFQRRLLQRYDKSLEEVFEQYEQLSAMKNRYR